MLLYRRIHCGYAFSRIPLSQGKFAIVDPDDYFRLSNRKWFAAKSGTTFYAAHWIYPEGKRRWHYMHREVCKVADDMFVDHVNHDGLDNRKANLRPATSAQNVQHRKKRSGNSRSRYKGVWWDNRWKKWCAAICVNRTRIHLGSYHDELEAARAYDRAAKQHHGQFASLNFQNQLT